MPDETGEVVHSEDCECPTISAWAHEHKNCDQVSIAITNATLVEDKETGKIMATIDLGADEVVGLCVDLLAMAHAQIEKMLYPDDDDEEDEDNEDEHVRPN